MVSAAILIDPSRFGEADSEKHPVESFATPGARRVPGKSRICTAGRAKRARKIQDLHSRAREARPENLIN